MGEVIATLGIWDADGSRIENVDMRVDIGTDESQHRRQVHPTTGCIIEAIGLGPGPSWLALGLADVAGVPDRPQSGRGQISY